LANQERIGESIGGEESHPEDFTGLSPLDSSTQVSCEDQDVVLIPLGPGVNPDEPSDGDVESCLFQYFTPRCLRKGLVRLDVPPGHAPHVEVFALGEKDLRVMQNRNIDAECAHTPSIVVSSQRE
jgi:hypothetical protein